MIRYKIDILDALKHHGYSQFYLIQNKILMGGTLAYLRNGKLVSWDSIDKICELLECDISDILEYIPNKYAIKEEGDTD